MDTTQNKKVQNLPRLVEKSSTYKLIVPEQVEAKIRYLIGKYPHTEWSGVLFYSHIGSFEDGSLQLTCEDFVLMDIGTSGWTQFKMNEDVVAYMANNMELFDCEIGLLHSHHALGAFLSGQDKLRLQEDGNDTNCFLSLVVDTPGNYVAALTRKIKTKTEVTTRTLGSSYEFFGNGTVKTSESENPITTTIEETVIECYTLNVEREPSLNPFINIDTRISELEDRKRITVYHNWGAEQDTKSWIDYTNPVKPAPKQQTLFDNEGFEDAPLDSGITEEKVELAISRMLLCNPLIVKPYEKLDEWVDKMNDYYDKAFPEIAFDSWADFIVEFCIDNFYGEEVPCIEDIDIMNMNIAEALIDALSKYTGNVYIDIYIEKLNRYII